ncbi:MAG TPA: Mur ligase family protein [Bacillota bacterium]|nr:Mur ligase family protein [Bacillota bacterium]
MRKLVAVWVGKVLTLISRVFHFGGGSSLPGKIALQIDPQLLSAFFAGRPLLSVVVTGSNGKTTTCRIIAEVLKKEGYHVVWNRSGANLITGITSALIEQSDFFGNVKADAGVFEVDEATMRLVMNAIKPTYVVVTNFFRDQLDRYGEVETTRNLIRSALEGISYQSFLILNADDPLVASLAESVTCDVKMFGIESLPIEGHTDAPNHYQIQDARNCARCGTAFIYDIEFYGHLGSYRCPNCGNARPAMRYSAKDIILQGIHGSVFTVKENEMDSVPPKNVKISLALPGLYNVYNALAAASCCLSMGFDPDTIKIVISNMTSAFGRMERISVGEKIILLALVKNPVGFSEVVRTLVSEGENKTLLLCLNDDYADGRDISWIWDADVELLAENPIQFEKIVASGLRAWDMALRLKYAGIDEAKIVVEPILDKALRLSLKNLQNEDTLYILPTYTAMLQIREYIRHLGHAREFWQG